MSKHATTQLSFDAETDVGRSRRGKSNEDSIGSFADIGVDETRLAAKGKLFVVADGMGGAAGGKEASSIAIAAVLRGYYDDPDAAIEASLERAFQAGNTAVQQHGRAHPELRGMGTTIAAAVVRGRMLVAGNVGDSRAYVLRGAELRQLSLDHTMVQEQVREGVLLPEEAEIHPRRHVLSRNLGYRPRAQPDFVAWTLQAGDTILLCSDGLWGPVGDDELARVLRKKRGSDAVRTLIELANERGGPDNISAVVVRVESVATGAGSISTEPDEKTSASVTTEPDPKRPGSSRSGKLDGFAGNAAASAALPDRTGASSDGAAAPFGPPQPGAAAPAATPAAPRPTGSSRLSSALGATTEPATQQPAVQSPGAPAAAAPGGRAAVGSRRPRVLPLALLTAIVLLGGALLYRNFGSGGLPQAGSDAAVGAAAQAVPSLAAAASRITQTLASDEPSSVAQAVASPAATGTPRATPSSAPSREPAAASAVPAEEAGVLSTFEVLKTPNSLALSPDGQTLAVGSSDGEILLLRASDGAPVGAVKAHEIAINSLAFSPNGTLLASAADDGTIAVWRSGAEPTGGSPAPVAAPSPEILRAAGQAVAERLIAIGLDGQQVVFAEKQEQQINLWRQDAEQPFSTLDEPGTDVQSIVFAPDGQSLALVRIAGPLELWRVASGAQAGTVAERPAGMWSVAFVPGQQSVVLGFPDSHVERRSYSFDDDVPGATPRASARAAAASGQPVELGRLLDLEKHDSAVVTVMFRDPQTLLSASRDGEIRQWSLGDAVQAPAEAATSTPQGPTLPGRQEPGE